MKKIIFWVGIGMTAFSSKAQISIEMVADINPAEEGHGEPRNLFLFNDKIYFAANNGTTGIELWMTDGTEEGTTLVKDINAFGDESSFPGGFAIHEGQLFFSAETEEAGKELWVTDGTTDGTTLFMDIYPGAGGSSPISLTSIGDLLYFSARDGIHQRELWTSDGTEMGTALVVDINDGDNSYPSNFQEIGGKILFRVDDGIHGYELWATDGTPEGTEMLKDIREGSSDGADAIFYNIKFEDKLFFHGNDGEHGQELWVTDGTAEGTLMLKDINPSGNGQPRHFTVFNDKIYFSAIEPEFGRELWVTDGTAEGTERISDINEGGGTYGNATPDHLTVVGDQLFFVAQESFPSSNRELYVTDGTASGTVRVKDINPDGSSGPSNFFSYAGKLYFTAYDGTNGIELWSSDGTEDGTIKIAPDEVTNVNPNVPTTRYVVYEGSLYFSANFNSAKTELWRVTDPDFGAGISKTETPIFNFFPNPTTHFLTLQTNANVESIAIFDLSGRPVKQLTGMHKTIDVSDLATGAYLIVFNAEGNSNVRKFIKK